MADIRILARSFRGFVVKHR
ncbi:uncharacterized protein G2W53_035737 [Senna tora]|uniref:Uncharacterized protein n=1 Tax=Senna tora TaxID=362788 RepID=A0A834T3Z9_9FABA|nr:uncharacterized protein G2W53_035737 [Senna tora]